MQNGIDEIVKLTKVTTTLKLLERKKAYVERRKLAKIELDNTYNRILKVYNDIDVINKKKSVLYNSLSTTKSTYTAPPQTITTTGYMKDNHKYIGVDPGVKTVASAIIMNSEQAGTYLLLSNKYVPLEQYLDDSQNVVKRMMKVAQKEVSANSINSKSHSVRNRLQLRAEKKKMDDIAVIEKCLSELGKMEIENGNTGQALMDRLEYGKTSRNTMISFYHESKWNNKNKNGVSRFTDKAYANAANRILKASAATTDPTTDTMNTTDTKPVIATSCKVYYGDASRGFGSRIKGHNKRSTERLQQHRKTKCHHMDTKEYLSSKLCCLCDSRIMHPKRRNGRTNLGVVMCINPSCFGRKNGFSLRGRDKNAAINILKIGIYKAATTLDHPTFSATSSSTSPTKISADHLNQLLYGHLTSWYKNIGGSPPLRVDD